MGIFARRNEDGACWTGTVEWVGGVVFEEFGVEGFEFGFGEDCENCVPWDGLTATAGWHETFVVGSVKEEIA